MVTLFLLGRANRRACNRTIFFLGRKILFRRAECFCFLRIGLFDFQNRRWLKNSRDEQKIFAVHFVRSVLFHAGIFADKHLDDGRDKLFVDGDTGTDFYFAVCNEISRQKFLEKSARVVCTFNGDTRTFGGLVNRARRVGDFVCNIFCSDKILARKKFADVGESRIYIFFRGIFNFNLSSRKY